MSTESITTDSEFKTMKAGHILAMPKRIPKRLHKKTKDTQYKDLKIYATSNKSSKERLRRMIMEKKESVSIIVDMC